MNLMLSDKCSRCYGLPLLYHVIVEGVDYWMRER